MTYSKIASILLYIIVGISILVVGFFYFGDNLIDTEAYEEKVEQLSAPAQLGGPDYMQDLQTPEADTAAADTTALAEDTSAYEAPAVVEDVPLETLAEAKGIELTFMEKLVYNRTDIALIWAYILVIIAAIFSLVFPVVRMFATPAMLVRALIGLVVVAGILGGAYALGSDAVLSITGYEGTDNRDPQVLKMVDTGLFTTYFILGLALLSILYSEVAKYFK